MPLLGRVACTILAFGSTGSCLVDLDDSAALFQRGQQLQHASQDPDRTILMDAKQEFRERDEFENYVDPKKSDSVKLSKKGKTKVLFNPFKGMISNINLAIDSAKDALETSTREVVHNAVAEMKDVGQQLSNQLAQTMHEAIQKELTAANAAEAASLLELHVGGAHKPKMEANTTSSSSKKKSKKVKAEFNPFKGLIAGINQAIDDVKEGLESTTRDIVHGAAAELKSTGQEVANELEQMQQDLVKIGASPASLLALEEVSEHKPKLKLNITSNKTASSKSKKKKAKIEFTFFNDLVSGVNEAIDSITDNLHSSTKEIIHDAAQELQKAGDEMKANLDETMRKSMQELPIVTAAPSSQ